MWLAVLCVLVPGSLAYIVPPQQQGGHGYSDDYYDYYDTTDGLYGPHEVGPDQFYEAFDYPLPPSQQFQEMPATSECLLILKHGGNSSCITTNEINRIITTVLGGKYNLPQPDKVIDEQYIYQVANLVTEISMILAKRYHIPADMIHKTLTLIDIRRTYLGEMCPVIYTERYRPNCDRHARYRTIDGTCNNFDHPHWGAHLTPLKRQIPAAYKDGVTVPRGLIWDGHGSIAVTQSSDLPNVRNCSSTIVRDPRVDDVALTMMFMTFGQLLDHDITATVSTGDPYTLDGVLECCGANRRPHKDCFAIHVEGTDPFYGPLHTTCLNFVRSRPGLGYGCRLGAREATNGVTAFIDGSLLYSSAADREFHIRAFQNGRLRMLDRFANRRLKELLPFNTVDPQRVECNPPTRSHWCFLGGDHRANEQVLLTALHTIWARYHNNVARSLQIVNPHWNDERLYQEARRIVGAVLQHITYNEYLPLLIGRQTMAFYGLLPLSRGFYNGYNPRTDSSASQAFASAAFRASHTLISNQIHKYSVNHRLIESIELRTQFFKPFDLLKPGSMDGFILGAVNQVCHKFDPFVTEEVTNHLFQEDESLFGNDLISRNLQRGRDHGLPGYAAYRKLCGLSPARNWHDLDNLLVNQTARIMSSMYKEVEDVDLFLGGIAEYPLPDAVVGPTFGCLAARQFKDLRDGDRFWYENGGLPTSFTYAQLQEIRKMTLSALLCETSDNIQTITRNPFLVVDHYNNPRLPCKNRIAFPSINYAAWAERPVHF